VTWQNAVDTTTERYRSVQITWFDIERPKFEIVKPAKILVTSMEDYFFNVEVAPMKLNAISMDGFSFIWDLSIYDQMSILKQKSKDSFRVPRGTFEPN
jgi:hypothetical protein